MAAKFSTMLALFAALSLQAFAAQSSCDTDTDGTCEQAAAVSLLQGKFEMKAKTGSKKSTVPSWLQAFKGSKGDDDDEPYKGCETECKTHQDKDCFDMCADACADDDQKCMQCIVDSGCLECAECASKDPCTKKCAPCEKLAFGACKAKCADMTSHACHDCAASHKECKDALGECQKCTHGDDDTVTEGDENFRLLESKEAEAKALLKETDAIDANVQGCRRRNCGHRRRYEKPSCASNENSYGWGRKANGQADDGGNCR